MAYSQKVAIEGDVNAIPVPVSGTVTALPAGTQNVLITSQPISQYLVPNPAITGAYTFSVPSLAGVVAANTFLTLYNPVGSGKTVSFAAAFISTVAGGAGSATAPMRGYRFAGAPTGGTVQGAATIGKFNSSYANPVAEVRLNNPTVTLGAGLWNTPPAVTTGAGGGQFVHEVDVPSGAPPFILAQGEGIAINCNAGDVDQVWNITVVWAEL